MNAAERIAYFSKIWKQVSHVFPYFDRVDLDIDQVYAEYLPRIMTAESDRDYCLLLAEFVNLLGDGHTDFSFPMDLRREVGFLPFSLVYVEGAYYLGAVEQGREELLYAKVERINGELMSDLLHRAFRYVYHVERHVYPSKLHAIFPFLLRTCGNVMETSVGTYKFDLVSEAPALRRDAALNAHVPYSPVESEKLEIRLYEGGILYANIPTLTYGGAAGELAAALKCGDVKGVVLDLRENEGGMTANGARIAELFLSGSFSGCCKRTRVMKGLDVASASQYARMSDETIERYLADGLCDREEVERCRRIYANTLFEEYRDSFGSESHRAMYDGPCVILTTRNTISAAEDMVAMFRSNSRAVILGAATHGTTGTPLMLPMPIGGGVRVCSVGYRLLDGTEFIGTGIQPDVRVENSIEDLRSGYDRVLNHALRMLR